jgi:hypothetical protein
MPGYDSQVAFIAKARLHAAHCVRVSSIDARTNLLATNISEHCGCTCV